MGYILIIGRFKNVLKAAGFQCGVAILKCSGVFLWIGRVGF
jgi:hypothetical protein